MVTVTRAAAVAAALIALALLALLTAGPVERFGPPMRVCAASDGQCQDPVPPDPLTDEALATLPVRPCTMYFVPNFDDCEAGLYKVSKLELLERRRTYEKEPEVYKAQLAQLNRVLGNYDTVFRRECKLTFNDWVQPDDRSFPVFHITNEELTARGNPRHWAFCFAPAPTAGAVAALDKELQANTDKNGATVVRTAGDPFTLSTGKAARLEFATMTKGDLVNTFCQLFNPRIDPALKPFYDNFAGQRFYAIDMTNDGILRAVRLYVWREGRLTAVPPSATETVDSAQDDVAQRPDFASLPQSPARFALESAWHCGPARLSVRQPVTTGALQALFGEAVEGGHLVYKLRATANLYVFHINTCGKVDQVTPKSIQNLMAFLGNAVPASIVLRGSTSSLGAELLAQKTAAHAAACQQAAAATALHGQLEAVRAQQRAQADAYVAFSQPDSGNTVLMQPETSRTRPTFAALRAQETDLQARFDAKVAEKTATQARINDLNLQLASIEAKRRDAVQTLQQSIAGKPTAVAEKPYLYISNDANVYFQVPPS